MGHTRNESWPDDADCWVGLCRVRLFLGPDIELAEVKNWPGPIAHHDEWDQRYVLSLPPVRDALRRWAIKSGEDDGVMRGRYVEVMNFPDRLCVQFTLETGSVGGVPIYCYARDRSKTVPRPTTQLIYEYSDVE